MSEYLFEADFELEKPGEECAIVGVFGLEEEAVALTFTAMQTLQHRGQTGAGMAVFNGSVPHVEKDSGLVTEALDEKKIRTLKNEALGPAVIGQDRYSTSGKTDADVVRRIAQPFKPLNEQFCLAHNGHLENVGITAKSIGFKPEDIDACESDTECITFMLDQHLEQSGDLIKTLHQVLPHIDGAYCFVINEPNRLIAVRDPHGTRPLSLGTFGEGKYMVASESVAFDVTGAEYVRDVDPGEILIIDENGVRSEFLDVEVDVKQCMFEFIYFADVNSQLWGKNVYKVREELGRVLAKDHPVDADLVIGIQDSGVSYAKGFAEASGIEEKPAIAKNRYINRTFILDNQMSREQAVRLKQRPNRSLIEGKRVVLLDDSIVRGTTMKELVRITRKSGAAEVHVRIPSPPYRWPCFYGMDTGNTKQLIAFDKSIEELREYIGADSLEFLSVERTMEVIDSTYTPEDGIKYMGQFCVACATGEYHTDVPISLSKKAAL